MTVFTPRTIYIIQQTAQHCNPVVADDGVTHDKAIFTTEIVSRSRDTNMHYIVVLIALIAVSSGNTRYNDIDHVLTFWYSIS